MGAIIDQINLLGFKAQYFMSSTFLDGGDDLTDAEKDQALGEAMDSVMDRLQSLIDSIWQYVIIGLAAVVVIWGAWIGIKIAIANKNEEKINSRDMLKNLFIGIIIIFVIAMGVPLIITALNNWL